jgi:hypothetical protein
MVYFFLFLVLPCVITTCESGELTVLIESFLCWEVLTVKFRIE